MKNVPTSPAITGKRIFIDKMLKIIWSIDKIPADYLGYNYCQYIVKMNSIIMAKTAKKDTAAGGKKPGPKDREYVNKKESYEVDYESKRKAPAKKFGSS